MEKRRPKGIQRFEGKYYKLAGTYSTYKERKIQSGDRYIRTCYWRSFISETKRKMETNHIFIKNNVNS